MDTLEFLNACPTAFHAAEVLSRLLFERGFEELKDEEAWRLVPDRGYFVRRGGAVAAWVQGTEAPESARLRVAAAHTDSPGFKLKPRPAKAAAGAARWGVEVYGSPLFHTWFDRDLCVAGRLMVRRGGRWQAETVWFPELTAVIPSLAVHLNREANKGWAPDPQVHLTPLWPTEPEFAAALGLTPEDLGDGDLFLVPREPAARLGGGWITGARLDNLGSCRALLEGLSAALGAREGRPAAGASLGAGGPSPGRPTALALWYDHEEIGSATATGAAGSWARDLIERWALASGLTGQDLWRLKARSLALSLDAAHAQHPNWPERHDPDHAPVLGGGPVLKLNAAQRYASTAPGALALRQLAERAVVPLQTFVMRSDLPCGSTVGPLTAVQTGLETVDLGAPIWAMHSIRETGHERDQQGLTRLLETWWTRG